MFKLPPLENTSKGIDITLIKPSTDGNTYFTHVGSSRKTLKFKTNQTYSYNEVIELLGKLDILWEEKDDNKSPDYIS